ncbi:hypothetical protein FHS42_005840 [Streptomyces zagrosensis]|uniref:Uncharacterized protein n=1 Tax=Streptomyces zagrosensis TaxID=1042984 RepID=A0A7W9QEZ6_9ACTN|nr:hypothetical protein [Streptomyces zagrosensis]
MAAPRTCVPGARQYTQAVQLFAEGEGEGEAARGASAGRPGELLRGNRSS